MNQLGLNNAVYVYNGCRLVVYLRRALVFVCRSIFMWRGMLVQMCRLSLLVSILIVLLHGVIVRWGRFIVQLRSCHVYLCGNDVLLNLRFVTLLSFIVQLYKLTDYLYAFQIHLFKCCEPAFLSKLKVKKIRLIKFYILCFLLNLKF